MDESKFEIIAIIAARKSAYYIKVRNKFLSDIKHETSLSEATESAIRSRLRGAIATLPNSLFISQKEINDGRIYSDLSIEHLGLNSKQIKDSVLKRI